MPSIDWGSVGYDPKNTSDPVPAKKGAIHWDNVNSSMSAPMVPTPELKRRPEAPPTMDEYAQGLGSGLNRGMANVVGMPVDTVANVLDLLKAGAGYGTSKLTGNTPPAWTEPFDRKHVPGSGAWLADKAHDVAGTGFQVDPNRVDDGLVRGLHNFGAGAANGLIAGPGGLMRMAGAMTSAGIPNAVGGKVAEAYPDEPAWAALASQLTQGAPAIAAKTAANAAALSAQGGREGMRQRIATANDSGGIPLTLGQATGNSGLQGMENIGAKTPFGGKVYRNFAQSQANAMQANLENIANTIDPLRKNEVGAGVPITTRGGQQIQSGISGPFHATVDKNGMPIDTSWKATTGELESNAFKNVLDRLPPESRTTAPETAARARSIMNPAPGDAQEIGSFLNSSAARKPAAAILAGVEQQGDRIPSGNWNPYTGQLSMVTPPNLRYGSGDGISFNGLWNMRKQVGEDAFSNSPGVYAPRAKGALQSLYGPMSQDLEQTAAAHGAGPEWGNYQTVVKGHRGIADSLDPFVKASTPEASYRMAENDFQNNPSRFSSLSAALPQEANNALAGSIVSRLGKDPAALQDADATKFSLSMFLKNAAEKRKNDPEAFNNLFASTGNPEAESGFNSMLKTSDMVKDSQHWLNNGSQTAPVGAAMGAVGGITNAIADGNTGLLAKIGAGLFGASQAPKVMTSQSAVNAVANGMEMSPLQRAIGLMLRSGAPAQYPTDNTTSASDSWPYQN